MQTYKPIPDSRSPDYDPEAEYQSYEEQSDKQALVNDDLWKERKEEWN